MALDFEEHFRKQCEKARTAAYPPLLQYVNNRLIDADIEDLPREAWAPLAFALKSNVTLQSIRMSIRQSNDRSDSIYSASSSAASSAPIPGAGPKSSKKPAASTAITAGSTGGEKDVTLTVKLAKALEGCLLLTHVLGSLELQGIHFNKQGISYIAKGIKTNATLHRLSLKGSRMGDEGCMFLISALRDNTTITQLQLSECELTDKSGIELINVIKSHSLRRDSARWELTLRGSISDDPSGISFVDLSNNQLANNTAISLGKFLHEDKWLRGVDLSRNCIRKEGVKSLSEGLKQNKTLAFLNLSDNRGAEEYLRGPDISSDIFNAFSSTSWIFTRSLPRSGGLSGRGASSSALRSSSSAFSAIRSSASGALVPDHQINGEEDLMALDQERPSTSSSSRRRAASASSKAARPSSAPPKRNSSAAQKPPKHGSLVPPASLGLDVRRIISIGDDQSDEEEAFSSAAKLGGKKSVNVVSGQQEDELSAEAVSGRRGGVSDVIGVERNARYQAESEAMRARVENETLRAQLAAASVSVKEELPSPSSAPLLLSSQQSKLFSSSSSSVVPSASSSSSAVPGDESLDALLKVASQLGNNNQGPDDQTLLALEASLRMLNAYVDRLSEAPQQPKVAAAPSKANIAARLQQKWAQPASSSSSSVSSRK